ncbi:Transducin/WD40 repeat-like superfamily protein isoform 2 [Hibiscus syriacus]|uniref:tRNA (guanine-N(7)-)-methyltransferase non-catalytic subunit n=1 Tax=Hibiscus syriacus TaxID=106335 RepID=A0A6A2Z2Q1_HIBSY|nr:tRNA (guanine-N(7)-)-methyltransferase non-catalytic subunit wdr4-like isoform X2 [Hibiscus syriacus]KAE8686148.1 Transducin/WD40 repeat-like superfamily protein isoform 2 [Hibiscus syriacus]
MEGAEMEEARVEDREHDHNNTQEDAQIEESEQKNKDAEVAPALVSVHPTQNSVAVAVGSDLRVFNLLDNCAVNLVDESGGASHNDSIRCIKYGTNGKLFVSAGDDKLFKVWSTDCWRCISTVVSEKRLSAVAISNDGLHVCFADKFGVVWVVDLAGFDGSEASLDKKAAPLLSHYCSIITSLEFSLDGRFIVSADRDSKIRVTVFPSKPLDGAHEIQSFCLGHTEFVSCLAFISSPDSPQGILVSGGGDSTVRLWDIISGSLLDTCEVGAKVESDATEGNCSIITGICTILDCTLIAVAIQSLRGIMLLACNLPSRTLSVTKLVSIIGENFVPTSLGSSISGGLLWMVTGASKFRGPDISPCSRVKGISGFNKNSPDSSEQEPVVLADTELPGGVKLLEKLQGSMLIDEKVFLVAADAVKTAMCNLLNKKQYSDEKREFRKRTRNDKKKKQ